MNAAIGDRVAVRTVTGRLVDVGELRHQGPVVVSIASEWHGFSPSFAPRPIQSWARLTHRVERIGPV